MASLPVLALLASFATSTLAHGTVQGIVADGTWHSGYFPNFQYKDPVPIIIGWSIPEVIDNGFVAPSAYNDPDIICHRGANPGGISAKVAAGSSVELQWTEWPDSHHGPVLDYLAKCSDICSEVDKTQLKFFKIGEAGMHSWDMIPGSWAADDLVNNNSSWTVKIPASIAPGNYVLRHEIIALHSAMDKNGAQNYPQCINLEITGDGTDEPAGVVGTSLYKDDDPGILINIYASIDSYTIPGPTLWSGNSSASPTKTSSTANAPQATATVTLSEAPQSQLASTTSCPPTSSNAPQVTAIATSYVAPPQSQPPSTTSCPPTSSIANATSGTSPSSKIADILNALPSGALTAVISTPTGNATYVPIYDGSTGWGDRPANDLPEGWTLNDILQWLSYSLKQVWSGAPDGKMHQRDFGSG